MRRLLLPVLVLAAALVVAACSSGGARPEDPTLAKGYDIYQQNCAVCHASDGHGGTGMRLIGVADRLDEQQIRTTIAEGRPGTAMPAWSERGLSPDDIAAVAAYVQTFGQSQG